jgi:hypothetical protein
MTSISKIEDFGAFLGIFRFSKLKMHGKREPLCNLRHREAQMNISFVMMRPPGHAHMAVIQAL